MRCSPGGGGEEVKTLEGLVSTLLGAASFGSNTIFGDPLKTMEADKA